MAERKWTPPPWRWQRGGRVWKDQRLLATAWIPRKVDETREAGESWLNMRARTQVERDNIDAEIEANARLIAAAPYMFEALAECITTMEHARVFVNSRERIKQPEGRDLYDEALAKARRARDEGDGT